MSTPLVSVIIPCYNAEQFVADAIESALGQTYKNVEVIVIDDGSTDGSLHEIRRFGTRIQWETGPNQGGCAARNRGITIAKGDWIQFLDADDLLYEEKISVMLPQCIRSRREIWFSDFIINDEITGERYQSPRPSDSSEGGVAFVLECERLQTSSPLYPKKAVESIGLFDKRLKCAQEYDLNLRLALSGWKFRRLRRLLYEVRTRGDSVSSNYAKVLRQADFIYQKLLTENKENAISQNDLRVLLSGRYARAARLLTRMHDEEGAAIASRRCRELGRMHGLRKAFSWKTRVIAYIAGPVRAERALMKIKQLINFVAGKIGLANLIAMHGA